MSRARMWIGILAVAILALTPVVSSAALLQLNATHVLTATLQNTDTNTFLVPTSGTISSTSYANAYYPSESNSVPNSTGVTYGTPASISSSATTATWVPINTGNNAYNGNAQFTMVHNMGGNAPAPSPSGGNNGYLHVYNQTNFALNYTVPVGEDGFYRAKVQDLYNLVYQLVNASGGSNWFSSTYGYSSIYIDFAAPAGGGTAYRYPLGQLGDSRTNSPNAVPDFSVPRLNQNVSASVTEDLVAGENVTFSGYVYSEFWGNSNNYAVPAPSTMLLLGSGLVGLGLLRRKWSLRK